MCEQVLWAHWAVTFRAVVWKLYLDIDSILQEASFFAITKESVLEDCQNNMLHNYKLSQQTMLGASWDLQCRVDISGQITLNYFNITTV